VSINEYRPENPITWLLNIDYNKHKEEEIQRMGCKKIVLPMVITLAMLVQPCLAASENDRQEEESEPGQIQQLEEIEVRETSGAPGLQQTPTETVIDVDTFRTIGPQTSVLDILKTQSIIDFRGSNGFDPGVDSIFLRGFDAKRFVTAIDGLTVQKTGGRKSSNIVDYSQLPTFLLKEIEILPGPHSALYDSKSIGGVINMVTRKPEHRENLKPDVTISGGYGTYDTVNSTTTVEGAVQDFTYDLAYQYVSSDGYLRNSETRIQTYYGRLGYLLPADGFVTLSASVTDTDRHDPVNNPGTDGDYDDDYPDAEGGVFDPYMEPTWDGKAHNYRLNVEQPLPIGTVQFEGYTGKSNRKRAYYASPSATSLSVMDTDWWQEGAKLQDEYQWTDNHSTILGFDIARLYDDGIDNDKNERINKKGAYLQHNWTIIPSLSAQLGLRYEDVKIWVTNNGQIPGRDDIVERNWNQVMPKSFFTWKMDGLSSSLRDTSLSIGISKIWRAPDFHGDYNPQGKPAGVYLDPEHGMGYDLVLNRRLWKDISLKLGGSFYDIKDYIATNSTYAKNSGAGAGTMRYSDYKINLKEVYRYGVDIELGGHILDDLSFYLSYSWQEFENQGDEPAGETELDQRAKNRMSAGLCYNLFENTALLTDVNYQSKETIEISEEVSPDVWDFRQVQNDDYYTVDLSVQQKLLFSKGFLRNAMVSVYVKNVFNEEYYDAAGFPATDRTIGTTMSVSF
jgi:outer membrane receptor protein involved in Fe transport